jgi:hypothetical protein
MSRMPVIVRRSAVAALLVCGLALVAVAPLAEASKGVISYFGNEGAATGTTGGLFNTPRGVAVNNTTGDIYVVDGLSHRIQRFDADGNFERAWGRDVVVTGGAGDVGTTAFEICTVAADCKAGTTGNAAGELNSPQGIAIDQATGDVYVTEQTNLRVQKFDANGNFLRMWGRDVLNPTGGTTHEVCTAADAVAPGCKIGTSGATGGAFASTFSGHVAVAPAGAPNAGNVVVADPGNRRVQEFDSSGAFVRAFGFDVVGAAGGADNTGTGFEVCTAAVAGAANCKIAAASGGGVGQFASSNPTRVAVDSTGSIYAVEATTNFRVQKFSPQVGPPALAPSVFVGPPLSGGSSTDTPTDVAIGSGDDVYVARAFPTVGFTPFERRIVQYDAAGTVLEDTHLTGAVINGVNGLAVDPTEDRAFVTSLQYGSSPAQTAHRVYVVDDVVAPSVTISPVTDIAARGATFNGLVDPNGAPAGYHFEYSTDNVNWTSFPPTDVSAGSGDGDVPVSQTISGVLKPSTLYHVRLVGKLTWGNESSTSTTITFVTDDAAPTVAPATDAVAGDTTAVLSGQVNPNSQTTTYRFEYGLTTGYGSSAPVPDGDVGSGASTVPVSAELSGLTPGTTYHYRLVATNGSGTTAGGDRTFTTDAAASACQNEEFRKGFGAELPDCRAYEQVSPVDKGGFDVGNIPDTNQAAGGPATVDGNAVAFHSFGAFADTPWGGVGTLPYLSRRDANGWGTTWLMPRPLGGSGVIATSVPAFTPDLSRSIVFSGVPLTEEGGDRNNFYRQDHSTRNLDLLAGFSTTTQAIEASDDLDHVALATQSELGAFPGAPDSNTLKVYEIAGDEIRLASREPGTDAPFQTASVLGSNLGTRSSAGAVSNDGDRIFFTSPSNGNDRVIYRRDGGSSTIVASPSQRTVLDPAGAKAKVFQVATPDGNRVFFKSVERLTDNANSPINPVASEGDLYRYDAAEDELLNLSAGTEGLARAEVEGVVGISDDGDRAYFAARGQVVPGQGAPDDGRPNLFLWEADGTADGRVRFIATLAETLSPNNPLDLTNWSWDTDRTAQTSPDGRYLIFRSFANITGYDPADTGQVYRYDASGDGGNGELACLSCDESHPPAGSAEVPTKLSAGGRLGGFPRLLSSNGRHAIFSSPNQLLPQDTNGKYDAYMWEDGELHLLSTGQGSDDSYAFSMSASGADVFFRTRDQLVPADGDTLLDLYTAHVGGGFASQQDYPAPDCAGEQCKGLPTVPPVFDDPPSNANRGRGNVVDTPSCARFTKSAKRFSTKAKRLRRAARRTESDRRETRLRKRATKLAKRAKTQRAKAKRCTRRNQEASR